MTGKPAVLIPSGARPPPGYQCLRSLGQREVHTIYGTKYDDDTTQYSRYCDETVVLPDPSGDVSAYKDRLLDIANRPDVYSIVPTSEYDIFVLSKHSDEFQERVSLAVPSFESLNTIHDRIRLAEAAEAANVPVPRTRPLDEVDDWDGNSILKSRYNLVTNDYVPSSRPNEASTVKNVMHLGPNDRPDYDEIVTEMGHVPIVQEYVHNENEYMVGALCDRGEPLAMLQLRQIREDSYIGGGGVYRKSVYLPELDRVARELLDELDWHGLACIEYMEDAETGEFKLAEINPRMWQSLAPTVYAGADFPYYYWLLATDRADLIDPDYEMGVGSHYLKGEVEHLVSIFEDDSPQVERPNPYVRAAEVTLSCLGEPRFDMLRFDDPRPFAETALSGLRQRITTLGERRPSLSSIPSLPYL